MTFLKWLFGVKDSTEQQTRLPEKAKDPEAQSAVVVKGEKHFDIFLDGNGSYLCQHKSGKWLNDTGLYKSFHNRGFYSSIEIATKHCISFINSHQLTHIGTIEFIKYGSTPKSK